MEISISKNHSKQDHDDIARLEEYYFDKAQIVPSEFAYSWSQKNKDIYILAKDKNNLVGWISFIPVDDYLYNLLASGSIVDTEITADHIVNLDKPGNYKVYFSVVCVLPEFKGKGISDLLIHEYAKYFLELKKKGVVVTDIIADTIKAEGVRFSEKSLGMKFKINSLHGSQIMYVSGNDFYNKLTEIMDIKIDINVT